MIVATVREVMGAKIAAAEAELSKMKEELSTLESSVEVILDKEVSVITGWYETVRRYL